MADDLDWPGEEALEESSTSTTSRLFSSPTAAASTTPLLITPTDWGVRTLVTDWGVRTPVTDWGVRTSATDWGVPCGVERGVGVPEAFLLAGGFPRLTLFGLGPDASFWFYEEHSKNITGFLNRNNNIHNYKHAYMHRILAYY